MCVGMYQKKIQMLQTAPARSKTSQQSLELCTSKWTLSTQLINVTSFIWKCNNVIDKENLSHISSYQTLSEATNLRSFKPRARTKLVKKVVAYAPVGVELLSDV